MDKFAAFVYTHNNPALTTDTVESVRFWLTKNVIVLVDACGWNNLANIDMTCEIVKGLPHGQPKSPYRNVIFGLQRLLEKYPDCEWYVYVEQDCLFTSDNFLEDIKKGRGKWFAGTNKRPFRGSTLYWELPLLNEIVGGQVEEDHYVLGCVMFFHKTFLNCLNENKVLDKLLIQTENFAPGYFPDFRGFAFEEQLFASLANYYKKDSILPLSYEHRENNKGWSRYSVRWQPDIQSDELSPDVSIIHPLKNVYDPIRFHYRKFRERVRNR